MRASIAELLIPSRCPVCDTPRPECAALLCVGCSQRLRRLDELAGVATAFAYEGAAVELIRRFKFDGRRDGLRALLPGVLARVRRLTALRPVELVVPVPRHRARLRRLGGDPTHDLARELARASGLPLLASALRRSRPTPPQTELDASERRRSPIGSFAVRSAALRGRRILLVDDVTTTGATLGAAADALRAASPARVVAFALAGTPPPR